MNYNADIDYALCAISISFYLVRCGGCFLSTKCNEKFNLDSIRNEFHKIVIKNIKNCVDSRFFQTVASPDFKAYSGQALNVNLK